METTTDPEPQARKAKTVSFQPWPQHRSKLKQCQQGDMSKLINLALAFGLPKAAKVIANSKREAILMLDAISKAGRTGYGNPVEQT